MRGMRRLLQKLALFTVGSVLMAASTCDLQNPLPNTETVIGVAIAQDAQE